MLDVVTKAADLDILRIRIGSAFEEDAEKGHFRVARDIFTDPELFELEMKHIFEGNWIYLAHESQIPNKNDYLTGYMGRQPIFIARNRNGELNAFVNACSHRGAMLCRHKRGNKTHLHLPLPRLDLQQLRQAAEGEGPRGRGLPGTLQQGRLARPDQGAALRELPRLPVRQPQPGRRAAHRVPRRGDEDHRHDRRPVARGSGGAARLLDLRLRRQLEAADRERRRRLPRQRGALELRRHHQPPQGSRSRWTTPAP